MGDWNNIIKRNRHYIKANYKIKTQVENNRLQQLGLTENLQTLFQPILKSQEDIKKRLESPIEPTLHIEPHHPEPIEYDEGLLDLMNGGDDFANADYKDFVDYSKFLHFIRKTGPETKRLKEVDQYIRVINQDDEHAEDNPIIQDIDEFEDIVSEHEIDELKEEIARENSGQGITFLSDNNEELLNRLEIILAAMKEGHRSDRQYNEVNCILKRFIEKGIIDKNDYKNVIDKIIQ
ncbi:hypothetical protein LOTGIDRAFT_167643 [Lottia gigantea]|uniref:Uncharacterized protein n=1 Tax=Lottia gigantea TaxID=225164 RepID=V4BAC4_LOTGI|nr:hypothetical protein LOTGIDRAFT_167643 [Lottia gigantea]ESO85889.1 hypothetical protein LOTGIDRAFT_167643 [Lottia gigantea]